MQEETSTIWCLLQLWLKTPAIYGILATLKMHFILTCWLYNLDNHIDHNSDTETKIIGLIFNSVKDVFRWGKMEMHYIINSDKS